MKTLANRDGATQPFDGFKNKIIKPSNVRHAKASHVAISDEISVVNQLLDMIMSRVSRQRVQTPELITVVKEHIDRSLPTGPKRIEMLFNMSDKLDAKIKQGAVALDAYQTVSHAIEMIIDEAT